MSGVLSSTGFSLCTFNQPQLKPHRLNRLRKKAENCHSERRVCAKNPSWSFVFNRERFFASLRMTNKALFPQPVKPELLLSITSVALTRKRHHNEGFPRITNHKSRTTN